MFERFTREARDVVTRAEGVARDSGARTIDSRHVLLGVVETPGRAAEVLSSVGVDGGALAATIRTAMSSGGLDADALASVGIDLDAVRERADAVFGQGALDRGRSPRSGHLRFAADAKKALELALREAIRLDDKRIDSGMLLLGLLRDVGSPAEKLLQSALTAAGSDPSTLRRAVEGDVAG